MIYLLPFFTAFLIYILSVEGQPLHPPYIFMMKGLEKLLSDLTNKIETTGKIQYKIMAHILFFIIKALGGCTVCFAGQIGFWSLFIIYAVKIHAGHIHIVFTSYWLLKEIGYFILLICYNSVGGTFLFRQLLNKNAPPVRVANAPISTKMDKK